MALNEKQLKMASTLAKSAFAAGCRTKEAVSGHMSKIIDKKDKLFNEMHVAVIDHIQKEYLTIIPGEKDPPAWSSFRELLTTWDEQIEKDKLAKVVEDDNFSFFFQKDKEFFGAPEESRIVFARMKNPDEDSDKEWAKDANFIGIDIEKAAKGEQVQRLFGLKDLKEIKVIEKDEVLKKLEDR